MRKIKNIMNSHECFCEELKLEISNFDYTHIQEFIEKYKNTKRYADYVRIYQDEQIKRDSSK